MEASCSRTGSKKGKSRTQAELKKLQGTWDVIEGQYDGDTLSAKDLKGFQLVFEKDRLTWKEGATSATLMVQTDPGARPAHAIDLIPMEGPAKNRPIRGVYQLANDRLILRLPCNYALDRSISVDFQKKGDPWAAHDARLVLKR